MRHTATSFAILGMVMGWACAGAVWLAHQWVVIGHGLNPVIAIPVATFATCAFFFACHKFDRTVEVEVPSYEDAPNTCKLAQLCSTCPHERYCS